MHEIEIIATYKPFLSLLLTYFHMTSMRYHYTYCLIRFLV